MTEFTTPMMKQYMNLKKQHEDCLLFFRLGDFYELFLEDAHIGSRVLGITLTGRPKGKDGRIPMAGVPYHAVDGYLAKLVKAGYKVAICEQVTEPNKQGIIEREVVRIVTPGTLIDERAIEKKEHNYVTAISIEKNELAIATCDLSTGEFNVSHKYVDDLQQSLSDQLVKLNPSECILNSENYNDPDFLGFIKKITRSSIFCFHSWESYTQNSETFLKNHFHVASLAIFGLPNRPIAIEVCAALLGYLQETQKNDLSHIRKISMHETSHFVKLDRATIVNLELFSSIRERDSQGTLLTAIDCTQTPMGGRLLKEWITMPLMDKDEIEKRLDAVEEFVKTNNTEVATLLNEITDLSRVLSKVTIGIGNARDLIGIKQNLVTILQIKKHLARYKSKLIKTCEKNISEELSDLINYIDKSIEQDCPINVKEGGIIKDNVDQQLDELRDIVRGGKTWITKMEAEERARTGINSLKLRFNKVFGYYIEISKANLSHIPDNYMRKQTLVNGERFITPELKEKEDLILTSEAQVNQIEYEIYKQVVAHTLTYIADIQSAAESIAHIDCVFSFAQCAKQWNYTRPTILYSNEIRVKDGRHPVVEQLVGKNDFVPNDLTLSPIHGQIALMTGPNMAGKSVYLRQAALITLLAHIGSFVPAKSAHIGIVDAIFVRSGASDVIAAGLSTFMVEMVETAFILNNATDKSLIVMDEIGRGTSTYDGVSIAKAIVFFLVQNFKVPPKTLFATHYHELTKLQEEFPTKIHNFHMEIDEHNGHLTFLHTIAKGAADKSFGVAVAALAGVPKEVVEKANEFLSTFSESALITESSEANYIDTIDLDKTTPIEALNILKRIKENKRKK
ncbi:DNA mismatch repair protein MutS [Candidatus Woesebacteria bacterium]|nr:DNA mismatch repair protein MutS [Candidatus Woesebacteria bacterium]MBP9687203.1 DNA mismatch repair protein MutS [Candidatus Woesebacteria bacterium]